MQNEKSAQDRQVLVCTQSCAVHKFMKKKRTRISSGSFQIQTVKETNHLSKELKTYYFKSKKFSQEITSSTSFVKIQYPQTTSFLYERNDSIISISFRNYDQGLQKLCIILNDFANIYTLESKEINHNLNDKIIQQCPENMKENQIYGQPQKKVKAVAKAIGKAFGFVNGLASKPLQKVGNKVDDKKEQVYEQKFSQQTKVKVSNMKQKSSNLNDKLTNFTKPVVQGFYNFSKKVGQKYDNSNNKIIKAVRDNLLAFTNSLNEAQLQSRNPNLKQKLQKQKQKQQKMKSEQEITTIKLK